MVQRITAHTTKKNEKLVALRARDNKRNARSVFKIATITKMALIRSILYNSIPYFKKNKKGVRLLIEDPSTLLRVDVSPYLLCVFS